jgi:hypothetical protein
MIKPRRGYSRPHESADQRNPKRAAHVLLSGIPPSGVDMSSALKTDRSKIAFKILGMPPENAEAKTEWDEAFRVLQSSCEELVSRFGETPGESLRDRSVWLSQMISGIFQKYASWRLDRIQVATDLPGFDADINRVSENAVHFAGNYLPYSSYLLPGPPSALLSSAQMHRVEAQRGLIEAEVFVLQGIQRGVNLDAREWSRKAQRRAEELELKVCIRPSSELHFRKRPPNHVEVGMSRNLVPLSFDRIPVDGTRALEVFAPETSRQIRANDDAFLSSHPVFIKDHESAFAEYIASRYRRQLSALLSLPSWSLEFRDEWERSLRRDSEVWLYAIDQAYRGFAEWWDMCRRCRESLGSRRDPIPHPKLAPLVWKIIHERLLQEFSELMPAARVKVGHSVKMSCITSDIEAALGNAFTRFKALHDKGMRGRAWYDGQDDAWIWTTDDNDECRQVASFVVGITRMDAGRTNGPTDWTWLDWLRQEERADYNWRYERDRTGKMAAFETGRFVDVLETSITNLQRLLDQATVAKFSAPANGTKGIIGSPEASSGARSSAEIKMPEVVPTLAKIKLALDDDKRREAVLLWKEMRRSKHKADTNVALYDHAGQHRTEFYKWRKGVLPVGSTADVDIRRALLSDWP